MGRLSRVLGWLLFVAIALHSTLATPATLDKIKFPYSPISWNSLPWWMAKDAGHFERNGLDVDLLYEGASSAIVQAMLAGEANFAGLAGPAVVSNVVNGGDVIQIAAVVKTFTVPMYGAPSIKELPSLKAKRLRSAALARSPISRRRISFNGQASAARRSCSRAARRNPPPRSCPARSPRRWCRRRKV